MAMVVVQHNRVFSQFSQLATEFGLLLLRRVVAMGLSLWFETILITPCLGAF